MVLFWFAGRSDLIECTADHMLPFVHWNAQGVQPVLSASWSDYFRDMKQWIWGEMRILSRILALEIVHSVGRKVSTSSRPFCQRNGLFCGQYPLQKSRFLTSWPWPLTLTIKLGQDIIKVHPHTKIRVRMSNGSARRVLNYRQTHTRTHTHIHTQTHGTDSFTSDRCAGGNKHEIWLVKKSETYTFRPFQRFCFSSSEGYVFATILRNENNENQGAV